jgi:hypothetical protein
MPKKYEPLYSAKGWKNFGEKPPSRTTQKKVFASLQNKEIRYKHSIPAKAVTNTLKKHKLGIRKSGRDKHGTKYNVYNKHGTQVAGFSVNKDKKVNSWMVY